MYCIVLLKASGSSKNFFKMCLSGMYCAVTCVICGFTPFLNLYLRIITEKLKPKHHFLLHYAMIFRYMGPFANVSCMRFEAMHKRLKAYCTASMQSRKNFLLSLATKFQLTLCYRFTIQSSILSCVKTGPGNIQDLSKFSQYLFFRQSTIPDSLRINYERFCMKWKSFQYKLGFALIVGVDTFGDLRFGYI